MPVLREASHLLLHALTSNISGPERFSGNADAICRTIVERCWTGDFYRTSLHNYTGFYCRDFGMCVDSLLALGYRKNVLTTLSYALERYHHQGRVTQQIDDRGRPFRYPNADSPDALAFLLYSIHAVRERLLLERYRDFLEKCIANLVHETADRNGLARKDVHLVGMRDHAIRESSCYDNTMLAAVQKYARLLGLAHPQPVVNYKKLLVEKFWKKDHFIDDLSGSEVITGDANVLPFWFGIVAEKARWKKTLASMKKAELDVPVPLRYESTWSARKMLFVERLAGGWERNTAWLHLGNLFLQVLTRYSKGSARSYLQQHGELIERERCYPEVLTPGGKMHKSPFFHADSAMLWAANYLALSKELAR